MPFENSPNAELERRVSELERRFDDLINRPDNTFETDFMISVERRVFRLAVSGLDAVTPGFESVLRRNALELEATLAAAFEDEDPAKRSVAEWMRNRASEIINEMLPTPET